MEQASYKVISFPGKDLPKAYTAMVYSKWLRSLRYGNDYFKLIDQNSFFSIYHKYIEKLLSAPTCIIRLAVLSDDSDVVLGWSSERGGILDYVHVHKDYRRVGIATSLVNINAHSVTHITKQGMSFWNNRLKQAKFNPFI